MVPGPGWEVLVGLSEGFVLLYIQSVTYPRSHSLGDTMQCT